MRSGCSSPQCKVVVLISGSGSNLQALIDSIASGDSPAQISAVISNRADAYGLQRAQAAGIATQVLDHKQFEGREAFDAAGPGQSELMLSKLALLLAQDLGDADRVAALIHIALADL